MPATLFPRLPLSPIESKQLRLIEANRLEYGYQYDLLNFANSDRLASAEAERRELLQWLAEHATFGYAGTKVDCTGLSPGCRHCGDGGWVEFRGHHT